MVQPATLMAPATRSAAPAVSSAGHSWAETALRVAERISQFVHASLMCPAHFLPTHDRRLHGWRQVGVLHRRPDGLH